MSSVRRIAMFGSVFSDHTRIRILSLLMERGKATTMDITTSLGLLQPRVSSHLAVLLKCDLVSVEGRGRQRIYAINPSTVTILKELRKLSMVSKRKDTNVPTASREAAREVRRDSAIRQCRSCYDHLAGVVGIDLLNKMIREGWLLKKKNKANDRILYSLTPIGTSSLLSMKVDIDSAFKSTRTFAYGCLDWTERVPHLGGALGSSILTAILSQGYVERLSGTRALKLTKPILSWIDSSKTE